MGETSNANLLTTGSIPKKIIMFAIPLLWGNLFQQLYLSLIHIFGISLGANVLAARFYAAGKDREMSETVHTSITLALISGCLLYTSSN